MAGYALPGVPSYGVRRPLYSVIMAAEAAMRNAIGDAGVPMPSAMVS